MGIIATIRDNLPKFSRQEDYELDEEWEELLQQLREELESDGFELEENEDLYVSLLAHVVKENEEGLEMLAKEEVAERARTGDNSKLDESSSVTIKTIKPQRSED